MPRMNPPKGYYTMTQAKNALNISDAMVRRHAKNGKIKYLVPEGREQGFYLKKDVDRLAIELNVFLGMEEKKEETEFLPANKEELIEIVKIADSLFSRVKIDNHTVPEWRYKVLEKNQETQFVLKTSQKVVGFATMLPFNTNTDKVEKLLGSERVIDANITEEDIETFDLGKHIHLYIAGIGIDPSIEKDQRRYYGARLISSVTSAIIELGARGIIIENISAIGATPIGVKILQSFGLQEIKPRKKGNRAFTMNMQESWSPVSIQYRKALEEGTTEKKKTSKKIEIY